MHAPDWYYRAQTISEMRLKPKGPKFESSVGQQSAGQQADEKCASIPQHLLSGVPLNNVRRPTTQVLGSYQVCNKSKPLR